MKKRPAYRKAVAPTVYASPVSWMIQRLKYGQALYYTELLASLMVDEVCARGGALPQALLPVPLHPRRQRQRGFNQARELARCIGRKLDIEVVDDAIVRVVDTPAQISLSPDERRHNVRNAFATRRPVAYRSVALVDDVMTTGSTVEAIAALLRGHGIETVDVWVCARTEQ